MLVEHAGIGQHPVLAAQDEGNAGGLHHAVEQLAGQLAQRSGGGDHATKGAVLAHRHAQHQLGPAEPAEIDHVAPLEVALALRPLQQLLQPRPVGQVGRRRVGPAFDAVGAGAGAHDVQVVAHEGDAGDLRQAGERAEQEPAQRFVVVERDAAVGQQLGDVLDPVAGRLEMGGDAALQRAGGELRGHPHQLDGVLPRGAERQPQHRSDGERDQPAEPGREIGRDRQAPARLPRTLKRRQ